jgi:hypothetical protein
MAERTIILKGERQHIRKEGIAGGAITPGHTVVLGSAGTYTAGPAAGAAPIKRTLLVAIERELEEHVQAGGNPVVGAPVDVAYAANDRLLMASLPTGCEWYALVPASAAAIVKGDMLEYAGGGALRKATTGAVVAVALEAVDNSAGGAPARIIVEAV